MTYKLFQIFAEEDLEFKKSNYKELLPNEKLRCAACNSIYWRVFYDRLQCMGCRSYTRVETDKGGDLGDIHWIRHQLSKYTDGRVRDPISKRNEFTVFKSYLRSRISGTELMIDPKIKGTWYYGHVQEKFKKMTQQQIIRYLNNTLQ